MNPTVWLILFAVFLLVECVKMDLMAASFAPGSLIAGIMGFMGLHVVLQILAFVVISGLLFVFARPELARYMNRHKKRARMEQMIGKSGVVICEIVNAHNVGVVNIEGKDYRARSNRPNAIIPEGARVKVVNTKGDAVVVDDHVRRSTERLPKVDDFDDFD